MKIFVAVKSLGKLSAVYIDVILTYFYLLHVVSQNVYSTFGELQSKGFGIVHVVSFMVTENIIGRCNMF